MAEAARPFDPRTGAWLPPPAAPAFDPEAPRRGGWTGLWNALLALDILAIVAVFASSMVADSGGPVGAADIAVSSILMVFLLGLVPFVWVVATRQGGLHGAIHYLKLERFSASLLPGVGLGLGCVAGVIVLASILYAAGYRPELSDEAVGLAQSMTLPLALLVSICAGVGEEIFFRGILQRWVGVWWQAVLFGLAHASYGTPLQVVIPFGLGLLFGLLVRRGVRLWVPIVAHVSYDVVMLMVGKSAVG